MKRKKRQPLDDPQRASSPPLFVGRDRDPQPHRRRQEEDGVDHDHHPDDRRHGQAGRRRQARRGEDLHRDDRRTSATSCVALDTKNAPIARRPLRRARQGRRLQRVALAPGRQGLRDPGRRARRRPDQELRASPSSASSRRTTTPSATSRPRRPAATRPARSTRSSSSSPARSRARALPNDYAALRNGDVGHGRREEDRSASDRPEHRRTRPSKATIDTVTITGDVIASQPAAYDLDRASTVSPSVSSCTATPLR